jgi:hypothetical protein
VTTDSASDGGYLVKAMVQGLHGHIEEPSLHGEMEISVGSLNENELRFYKVKGRKREKIRIDKPDRFIYVIKGWLKKKKEIIQ